jgi:putative phosphoesterase
MKIAVLSDVHGNFPALVEITEHIRRWKPDRVFVAGDIVNRGPRSEECLLFLDEKRQYHGWQVLRGNHEDYVIDRAVKKVPKNEFLYPLFQPVYYTIEQLNNDISRLIALPNEFQEITPENHEIRVLHASMRHNRDGIYPETSDVELSNQIAPPPKVFITGHTHRPLIRMLNGTLVVNAGSCGLPFDGDQRAGYAQITHGNGQWHAEIIRMNYDIQQSRKDFYETGYLEGAGPVSRVVLRELDTALSQLYFWTTKYEQAILAGEITVSKATKEFLSEPIRKPYW